MCVQDPTQPAILCGQAALAWLGLLPGRDLDGPRGSAPVARARQIGMYLMHVSLSASLTRTGRGFKRDRTTARHACAVIEDWREDSRIDYALDQLEGAVRRWTRRFVCPASEREA